MTVLHSQNSTLARGLEVRGLRFGYNQVPILSDVDITIREGEFISLLGPSGCGKTTLLRLLAGLEMPGTGEVLWNGEVITGPSLERGVVFQDYSIFPWMTLLQNITLAIAKAQPRITSKWRKQLAEEYLDMVGLSGAARKYPLELSGGMQQRGRLPGRWRLVRRCC